MSLRTSSMILGTAASLIGGGIAGAQETEIERLEREVRQLRLQNENLRKSYSISLENEEAKTKILREVEEDLARFGKDFFEEKGDTRLRNAVTDYQVASEKLTTLKEAASDLLPHLDNYLRTAIAADPEARRVLEGQIRNLQVALEQRQSPKRKIEQGSAQEARVLTIDSDTGAIVINAGQQANLTVGMQFRIERAGREIGDAIVAVVRPNVSGLLLKSLTNPEVPVQPDDFAKIILNSDPTN